MVLERILLGVGRDSKLDPLLPHAEIWLRFDDVGTQSQRVLSTYIIDCRVSLQ